MSEINLHQFIDIHSGETAWLFGKGPSIDAFDFADAGPLRVAINDLIGRVPDCRYGFSYDRIHDWIDLYRPGQVLFTPYSSAKEYTERPACDVCIFRDGHGIQLDPTMPKERLADCLQIREGTLGSALQVLWLMGVKRIIAVGIDGGNTHGRRFAWRTTLQNEHYKQYNRIKHGFAAGCRALGIEVQFFKSQEAPMNSGMKTVIFTGNTAVRGIHHAEGSIATLPEADARDVVAAGQARFTSAPVPPAIETATAEPVMETPEKAPVKRTRRTSRKKKATT